MEYLGRINGIFRQQEALNNDKILSIYTRRIDYLSESLHVERLSEFAWNVLNMWNIWKKHLSESLFSAKLQYTDR